MAKQRKKDIHAPTIIDGNSYDIKLDLPQMTHFKPIDGNDTEYPYLKFQKYLISQGVPQARMLDACISIDDCIKLSKYTWKWLHLSISYFGTMARRRKEIDLNMLKLNHEPIASNDVPDGKVYLRIKRK